MFRFIPKRRYLLAFALGLFLAVGVRFAPAHADCGVDCRGIWGDNSSAYLGCMSLYNCYGSNTTSGSYGAIAYGARSTAYGYSFGKQSASEADRTAMSLCQKDADDCHVVASFYNSCAAVAAIEEKGVFEVGQGSTRRQAESSAMNACASRYGRTGCEIETWGCSH